MPPPAALALFAHPDDETLACGATLAALVERGWDVSVAFLSDGVVTARGGRQDNRGHAMAACATLGTGPPAFLDIADQRFDEVVVADLVNAARALPRPDLLLTNAASDLNHDHQVVNHVARVLARPIGRPVALVECEVPAASAWNGQPFAPNWYVDATATLDVKLKALACYTNETRAFPHPCSPEAVEALAIVHGAVSGFGRAEAFHVVRGYAGLLP